ncbi:hypothetical protein PCASD_02892 [Puccinia coronata f. sp. avenae]|uniref:Uncharacterized protein n=1 Tax=Puccinia coronata f. sp. avenae TaxID=200324 RepID=A0A2N5VEB1_9BASI|nr:hypothetical protein PCASD_02892 [Puccinia coronata f. sp. avenae]
MLHDEHSFLSAVLIFRSLPPIHAVPLCRFEAGCSHGLSPLQGWESLIAGPDPTWDAATIGIWQCTGGDLGFQIGAHYPALGAFFLKHCCIPSDLKHPPPQPLLYLKQCSIRKAGKKLGPSIPD